MRWTQGKDRWKEKLFFEFLDAAVSEAHLLDFSAMGNNKHSFSLGFFELVFVICSQTTATVSLVLLSSLSFLPPGPWAQFSLVPKGREIRLSFYSKAVTLGDILITPVP